MSKQSFSFLEGVIAVGALVTSSAAVFIAWDQAQIMRAEQHEVVRPAIQIDRYEEDEGASVRVGFKVTNAGVGPAFLMNATLSNGDEVISGYERLAGIVPDGMRLEAEPLTGRVIAPGVERNAMQMRWSQDPTMQRSDIYVKTDKLVLRICYCSTLGRCWESKSSSRELPKKLDKCAAPKEGLF